MEHGVGVETGETDPITEFIDRVDRLEKRYRKAEYKYVDAYMMPRKLMKALRNELNARRSSNKTENTPKG